MIVELFGPPGAGKALLVQALLCRLQRRGYRSQAALAYRPDQIMNFDPGGVRSALSRIIRAMLEIATMALQPNACKNALYITVRLVRILPPRNLVWRMRVSQYILRLCQVWRQSADVKPIVIFDHAFIQSACALAVFNRAADDAAFLRVLNIAPLPDVLVHVRIDREAQKARLLGRIRNQPMVARLLEASPDMNLRFGVVADQVSLLLQRRGHPVVEVRIDDSWSIDRAVDEIEREIAARLEITPGPAQGALVEETIANDRRSVISEIENRAVRPPSDGALPIEAGSTPRQDAATRHDRFTRTSIAALLTYVGGAGLTCAVQFLVARLLHAEAYGVYSYVWAWASLLSYGATLGLTVFVLRFTSAYGASRQWSLMYGSIRFAVGCSVSAAGAALTIGLLIVASRWNTLKPDLAIGLVIGILAVPFITLHLVGASIVRVFGGFIAAILPERVFRDGLLLVIIILVFFSGYRPLGAKTVLAAALLSSAATLALIAYTAFALRPAELANAKPAYLFRDWWVFALPVMMMMALDVIMTRTGVLVLGWHGKISDAGVFALAYNLAMLVQLSRAAVALYFSPEASGLHARGDMDGLKNLYARATALSMAGGAVLAVPVLLLTVPLLRLFGQDFENANIAQILVIGQLLAAVAGPQQNLLMMTGNERATAIIMAVFAMLNLAGCSVAVDYYGGLGAAVVTSATLVLWNATMGIYVWRRLGIAPGLVLAMTKFRTDRAKPVAPKG